MTLGYLGPEGTFSQQAARRMNMVKIESRPDKRSLGRYVFLVDLEGHRTDPVVADALEEMRASASMFKILGSYPRAAEPGASAATGPGSRADRLT